MMVTRARWFLAVLVGWLLFAGTVTSHAALPPVMVHPAYEAEEPGPLDRSENLFAGARVSESGHWRDREARLAVDGQHDRPGEHWGADNKPVWLTVKLAQPRDLNVIRLWTYWNGQRAYQYLIEGSTDGKAWTPLVDRQINTQPATSAGETFGFPAVRVQFVRTTIIGNSQGNNGHIVEIEGYHVPPERVTDLGAREKAWLAVKPGLHAAIGSKDVRYRRGEPPVMAEIGQWSGVAWRGERVSLQAILWTAEGTQQVRLSATPLRSAEGKEIPASCVRPQFVRYVLASQSAADMATLSLEPDVVDTIDRLDLLPRTARPAWVSIEVPTNAAPGKYQGQVRVAAAGGQSVSLPLDLEVLPLVLPPPAQWKFRLDLWQDPWSVAWYYGVEPWSEAHFRVLGPHLRMLANAGQKFITTYVTFDPWGECTYIDNGTMVEWIRKADGTFRFDYTVLDRYVEFAQQCGITEAITCYTMLPGGQRVRYLDEPSGDYLWATYPPGTEAYEAGWTPFLNDFSRHLRERGWFDKTYIGINENPPKESKACLDLLRRVVPGLKVTWAGNYHAEFKDRVDDWCFIMNPPVERAVLTERLKAGRTTTYYVCCSPARPNTFTFSPPAEAAWLGWYAAAQGYDGFLRWAYDSWVRDPLYDTRHVRWPAGDCFMVYPGPRSSIRFERLREGIADFEKIRLLRQIVGPSSDALRRLDECLSRFTYKSAQNTPASDTLQAGQDLLVNLSREAAARTTR